jgi:hypothetical protein
VPKLSRCNELLQTDLREAAHCPAGQAPALVNPPYVAVQVVDDLHGDADLTALIGR